MKKVISYFIITITICLMPFLAKAQTAYEDVVYLKNGSIIHGLIIEQVPSKSIKIQTTDGNVFFYSMEEIEKITKEPSKEKEKNAENSSGLKSGYKGVFEMGYAAGIGGLGMDRLKMNIINGYQVNSYLSLGLGTGLRYYFDANAILIPLYFDCRITFLNKNLSPYLSLDGGYSFDATNSFEVAGFLFNPVGGVSIRTSQKTAMIVGVGYEMQWMNFIYSGYSGYPSHYYQVTQLKNSGSISFKVGISF